MAWPRRLVDGFKAIVERAVHDGAISARDRRAMIDAFKDSIHGYTYFEH